MPRDAVMDEASMKSATRQFDLSLCYTLSMKSMNLRRMQNLHLVPNLTELDLSDNRIGRVEGLVGLESLKRLVLANNEIERLDGLDTLDALESLQLQGNRVTSIDDVQCLTTLPCLRHLQFQSLGSSERNPMCDHPAYRTAVRRMLPSLQTLDGERTLLADAALPSNASNALADLTLPDPEPWLKDFHWSDEQRAGAATSGPLKGQAEFDSIVTECKRLDAKAQSIIEDYRARTPR